MEPLGDEELSFTQEDSCDSAAEPHAIALPAAAEAEILATLSISSVSGDTCEVEVGLTQRLEALREPIKTELGLVGLLQLVCQGEVLDAQALVDSLPGLEPPDYAQDLLAIHLGDSTDAEVIVVEGAGLEDVNGAYRRHRWNMYVHSLNPQRRICFYASAHGYWPSAWYMEDNRYVANYCSVPDQLPERLENGHVPCSGWLPWTGRRGVAGPLPSPGVRPASESEAEAVTGNGMAGLPDLELPELPELPRDPRTQQAMQDYTTYGVTSRSMPGAGSP